MSDRNAARAFLAATAEHHIECCKIHEAASERDNADVEFHKAMLDAHAIRAESCMALCKAMDASGLAKRDDGMQIVPSAISAVAPDVPSGIRAVPRFGQRMPNADIPDVPEVFKKIVAVDE